MDRYAYLDSNWEQVLRTLKLLGSFKLRASGVLVLHCFFHREKTPSLHLWPSSRRFRCHGCGVGGDIVDFVIQYQGLNLRREDDIRELEAFFENLPRYVAPGQLRFDFTTAPH